MIAFLCCEPCCILIRLTQSILSWLFIPFISQLYVCNLDLYDELLIYITDHLLDISTRMSKSYLRLLRTETELSIFPFQTHNFCRNPFSINTIIIHLVVQTQYFIIVVNSSLSPSLKYKCTHVIQQLKDCVSPLSKHSLNFSVFPLP